MSSSSALPTVEGVPEVMETSKTIEAPEATGETKIKDATENKPASEIEKVSTAMEALAVEEKYAEVKDVHESEDFHKAEESHKAKDNDNAKDDDKVKEPKDPKEDSSSEWSDESSDDDFALPTMNTDMNVETFYKLWTQIRGEEPEGIFPTDSSEAYVTNINPSKLLEGTAVALKRNPVDPLREFKGKANDEDDTEHSINLKAALAAHAKTLANIMDPAFRTLHPSVCDPEDDDKLEAALDAAALKELETFLDNWIAEKRAETGQASGRVQFNIPDSLPLAGSSSITAEQIAAGRVPASVVALAGAGAETCVTPPPVHVPTHVPGLYELSDLWSWLNFVSASGAPPPYYKGSWTGTGADDGDEDEAETEAKAETKAGARVTEDE